MSKKPLYFLTHEDNLQMFSGYGIPISEGKSPLAGMLMIDRPSRYPERYIQELKETFDEVIIGPMTMNGDRGLFTQMRIEDPYSLDLVKNDFSGPNMEETKYVLNLALKGGFLPKTRLRMHWSRENQLWMSEFDLDERHQ
jgi:hypothetical protein